MSRIDDMIRQALECEDRLALKESGELGFFALGLSQFRGVNGWVAWVLMIAQGLFFVAGVWCMILFYQADNALSALKWGISGAVALLVSLQLKLSLAPQMQADRVIRELKRLELLLASNKSS